MTERLKLRTTLYTGSFLNPPLGRLIIFFARLVF